MTRSNGSICIGCGLVRCGCGYEAEGDHLLYLQSPGQVAKCDKATARPDVPHYTRSHIEPLDVIRAWGLGFELGNVIKYVARCDHKADPIADLKKARDYIDLELERRLNEE